MSDLALGNLIELKRRLLPATLLTQTTYDETITAIGRGVAGLMDKKCNRKFARSTAAQDQFSADRLSYVVERFPVESITTIEIRDNIDAGWVTQDSSLILNRDDAAGLIHFGTIIASHLAQVRLTYSGGYWYDTAETEDTALPSGATRVPYDVKEAWYLQCESVWQVRDKLGTNILSAGGGGGALLGMSLPGLDLIPMVKQILGGHQRFQMT